VYITLVSRLLVVLWHGNAWLTYLFLFSADHLPVTTDIVHLENLVLSAEQVKKLPEVFLFEFSEQSSKCVKSNKKIQEMSGFKTTARNEFDSLTYDEVR
jgi:hypothetical protein